MAMDKKRPDRGRPAFAERVIGGVIVGAIAYGTLWFWNTWELSEPVRFAISGVLGVLFLLFGGSPWRWIRNAWFRLSHLGIIAYISFNAVRGELCFLTHWEADLRTKAGQQGSEASFLGQVLHDILFVDLAQRTLDKIYLGFAAVVLLSLVCIRPRMGRRARRSGGGGQNRAAVQTRVRE